MAAEHLSWEVAMHSGGTVIWMDSEHGAVERFARLREKEWMSWIAGVPEACGKIALAEALEGCEAPFWPRSWRVPEVNIDAIAEEAFAGGGHQTLIVKPDQGSQGSGIILVQTVQELRRAVASYLQKVRSFRRMLTVLYYWTGTNGTLGYMFLWYLWPTEDTQLFSVVRVLFVFASSSMSSQTPEISKSQWFT